MAGLIMSWARALGEFGATMVFAGNMPGVTRTMPLAIYSALTGEGNIPSAIALSLVLLVISFIVMVATKFLLSDKQRSAENTFAITG
jgi:molybdate transport system permease protein